MTAKLTFKAVRAKNFRSFGNQFIEFKLDGPRTLVCSNDNGAGKSTGLTHALTFGFFDKAYQKGQKKTSLLNSKNGKDCVVEIEFETKGSQWLVRRGIKPNLFDIVKDGVRVTDEAARGDYQKYLIDVIGMDDKVFFNTVVLGRDKFVPFNEMSAGDLRNYAEMMLDQQVFSRMNEITKDDVKEVTRQLSDLNYAIGKTDSNIASSKRVIDVLEAAVRSKQADNAGLVDAAKSERDEAIRKVEIAEALIVTLNDQALEQSKKIVGMAEAVELHGKMSTMRTQLMTKHGGIENTRNRLVNMTACPTCEQEVSEARKEEVKAKLDPELQTLVGGVQKISDKIEEESRKINDFRAEERALIEINNKLSLARNGLSQLRAQVASAENRIKSLSVINDAGEERDKIVVERATLATLEQELRDQQDEEKALLKKKSDLTVLLSFLKDDAFKAEITKLYIPVLNQKVNEFLDAMNLWVNITVDTEFGMTMFAPDRKGQSISDLSTGQMRRIDLAMLLAWREVARIKSSVDTNLIIMDEVLENLSAQGVSDFVEFFESKYPEGTTLFVITQRNAEFGEYFDNVVELMLKDDFTVVL